MILTLSELILTRIWEMRDAYGDNPDWKGARWNITFPSTSQPDQLIHIRDLDLALLTDKELLVVFERVVHRFYTQM